VAGWMDWAHAQGMRARAIPAERFCACDLMFGKACHRLCTEWCRVGELIAVLGWVVLGMCTGRLARV
jgi:hypothetical protein